MVSRSGYLIAVTMVLLTMIIVGCVTAQDIPDVEATVVVMLEEEKEKSLPTPLSTEARLDEIKAKTFATPTPLPQPTASNEPLKTMIDSKEVIQIPTITPTPRPGATPQNPLLPSTPTQIPPTEIVSDLEPMKCSDIERMKSDSSIQQEVDLEFRMLDNTGNYPLEIFWKDFQGKEVEYGSVGPGSSFNISTYTEHLWVLRRTNGDCVTGFIVEKSDISRNPEGLSAIINNLNTLEQTLNLATPTPIPTLIFTPTPRPAAPPSPTFTPTPTATPTPVPSHWISSGGSTGPLVSLNDSTDALVIAHNPLESSIVMSSEYGEGKVLAFGHEGFLINIVSSLGDLRGSDSATTGNTEFDNDDFLMEAINWFGSPVYRDVKITTNHNEFAAWHELEAFRDVLVQMGYIPSLIEGEITSSELSDTGILILGNAWGEINDNEISAVHNFVEAGGGLIMGGLGWSWLSFADDPNWTTALSDKPGEEPTLENYPMNKVAKAFGIQWADGVVYDNITDSQSIFLAYDLEEKLSQSASSNGSVTSSSNQIRLTDSSANDTRASWSPDGKKIAFQSDRDGNDEIYVMDADGTNQTNLTNNPASDRHPSWTPNGDILFDSNRDGDWEIYKVTVDGSSQINLSNSYSYQETYPVMSPDSSSIAYMSDRNGLFQIHEMPVGEAWTGTVQNSPIFSGHEDSDASAADWILGDEYRPQWSPDGTKIVFYYRELLDDTRTGLNKYSRQISIMDSNGTGRTNLTEHTWQDYWPSWSPDGTKIAFMSNRENSFHLYIMNPDGSDQTRVTKLNVLEITEPYSGSNYYTDRYPSWSPDGTKMAFGSKRDGNYEIYVIELDENLVTSPQIASPERTPTPTPTPTTLKVFSHPDEVIKALDKHNIINCQTRATNTEGNIRRGGIEQEYLAFWGVHNDEYVEVSIPTLVCALESERDTLIATYGAKIRGPWIQISTFDDIEQADIYKNSGYKIEDSFFHSNVLIDISAVTFDETSYSETVYFSVDSIVEDLKDGSDRAAEEVNFKRTFLNTDEVIQALDKHPVRISYGEYDCYDNYDGGLWDSWDDENPFETLLNHATQTVDCRLDLSEAQQTALGTYSYGGQMRPHSGLYQRIQISIYYDESQMDLYRNTCQNDGNCLDVTTYFHDNAMIKIYSNDPTNKVITFPMPSILEDLLDGAAPAIAAPAIAAPAAAVPYTQQEGFELVEYELKTDVWGYKKLFGVVENNTNYTQTEVSIQFAIYDANGSKVEDVLVEKYNFFVSGSTDSIAPGEKWEFEKYPLYPEKAETVEVVVLSGVPK